MTEVNEHIKKKRHDFSKFGLELTDIADLPLDQLKKWFDEAMNLQVTEFNACTLSTVDYHNQPSVRIVYTKEITDKGLVFFTNYSSRKGNMLKTNPKAAINFFWPELERQISIEGVIQKTSEEYSDDYFNSRPRESKIGAHASLQSKPIRNKSVLVNRVKKFSDFFEDKPIPRPSNWGGLILIPNRVEFWQGRPSRLHDRFVYELNDNGWKIERLNP
ncbi:MAG: pyridoxamine 5'-phosphate oxidase [Flavobacteriales bacterium]|nr:pyridoxamine 5'-phosphate oxidase [Flavobacteriales bacterium]